jgi:FixJ family two-component response regulator
LSVVREVKARYPNCPVIMFTATGNQQVAVDAMKSGLDDYVLKSPKHYVRLAAAVRTVLERTENRLKAATLQVKLESLLNRLTSSSTGPTLAVTSSSATRRSSACWGWAPWSRPRASISTGFTCNRRNAPPS